MPPHSSEKSCLEDEENAETAVNSAIHVADAAKEPKEIAGLTDEKDFEVVLDPAEDPKQWSNARKWFVMILIYSGALCGTCASAMASFAEDGISHDFHVSKEVTILGISLFVLGLGIGPLVVGPLSEVYGRRPIYIISYTLFFGLSWPVAFFEKISIYIVFRFVTGCSSSAFLSVAGGTASDIFDDASLPMPMAIYTAHLFIGPTLGPLFSGFIAQNTTWRWIYRMLLIWIFCVLAGVALFMPETYVPSLLKRKARRLRRTTKDLRYWAPIEKQQRNMLHAIALSCYVPFKLMAFDGMALCINLWAALVLGIQYLTFQAFPIVFERGHGFSMQQTGMTFIGMGVGLLIGLAVMPFFHAYQRRLAVPYGDNPPPELRLIPGQFGAVLIPPSLYWLAFTTYPHVHWIVPVLASVPFGTGIMWCFTSIFTYLVTAYRPIAASAMASNTFTRTSAAAAFPLFAGQMYNRLGTVGATALLAGLTTLAAPLPFIFYRLGARLRAKSRFAAS